MSLPQLAGQIIKKIPWKQLVQVAVVESIQKLLESRQKRKSSSTTAPVSKPADEMKNLTTRVQKLEDDLETALEAFKASIDELGKKHAELVFAAQIISLRAKIGIILAAFSALVSVGTIVWIALR